MSLAIEVRKLAKEKGADLVGVADIERFDGAPAGFHPINLFPGTKSVISIAIRILRGVEVPQKKLIENLPYQIFGYGWLSHIRLNWVAFEIAKFLEDKGYPTLPFPSFVSGGAFLVGKSELAERGIQKGASISHRHAAVAAGLGTFGWCNLLITPEFGTHQRLVTILTTAELEPDNMRIKDYCSHCDKCCVKVCPAKAFSLNEETVFNLAGHEFRMAKLDKPRCGWYHDGMSTKTFGTVELQEPEKMTWAKVEEGRKEVGENSPQQLSRSLITFTTGGYCGLCLIACPYRKNRLKVKDIP